MKATLCLLEVSRHGLLETELLALLGDSNNIECPPFNEEGEEELIIKAEEAKLESGPPIDATKDDVEKLTDKFSKLVDEGYVIKEDKPDDASKAKQKRAKGKQVNFAGKRLGCHISKLKTT